MEAMEAYVEAGGNFIDTARNYHDAELRVGKFLKRIGDRDRFVLASKVWQNDEATIRAAVDGSRKLLDTDVIDIFYLHNPPDEVDEMNRVLDIYDKLKEEGKIRFTGATIKGHNVTQETVDLMHQYINSGRCNVIMCIYSVLRQMTSLAYAHAVEAGVGIVARTVMESGFLTGKYKPGHSFNTAEFHEQDHRRRWAQSKLDGVLEVVAAFSEEAKKAGFEPAQAAVRFALETPGIASVLLGSTNARQVKRNVAIAYMEQLTPEAWQAMEEKFGGNERLVSIDL